ncbi:MAG TPA: hypothetical protein IAB57_01235 [Candidatus Fimivivens faecavium]|nr:hypothetical protein [Candidatus Fimivivens faecavium]
MDIRQDVLNELDSRIGRLRKHRDDWKDDNGNEYEKLNHAVSTVLSVSLEKELLSVREFVNGL